MPIPYVPCGGGEVRCKGPGSSVSRSQPTLAFNRSHTTLPTLLGQDVMKSTETTDKPGSQIYDAERGLCQPTLSTSLLQTGEN